MFHQFYLNNFNISKSFLRNYSTIILVKLSFTILDIRPAQAFSSEFKQSLFVFKGFIYIDLNIWN